MFSSAHGSQKYLQSVEDLRAELEGRNVGVFAVCGQPKEEVELMKSDNNLKFKVRSSL